MMAVVDAAIRNDADLQAHSQEARVAHLPVDANGFRKFDRTFDRHARVVERGIGGYRILGAKHQPVQTVRVVKN